MKRTLMKVVSFLIVICMMVSNVMPIVASAADFVKSGWKAPFSSIKNYDPNEIGAAKVDETSLLILVEAAMAESVEKIPLRLADLGVVSARVVMDITDPADMAELGYDEPVMWMLVELDKDHKATAVAKEFEQIPYVLDAEYNFEYETAAVPTEAEYPMLDKEYYVNEDIKKAWTYMEENGLMDELSEVVVAVIDTGVDYTHPDLVNSMWVNVNETPNNGIDDDGNGYVDDVYGANTVGNSFDSTGDPMDDNGHGTHVAGIIAANGSMAGVACGAKIMAVKAGAASGVFHDSDIIEGINYAVQMGADVINMSFGGYGRSATVENALALAYTHAVLIAASGNEGADLNVAGPVYPAAYNYVLAVMALDTTGQRTAPYSNTDFLRRNSMEYEVAALGTSMYSTLPNGEYATWSGTSMAAPYVSAIAALLRAKLDKEVYSSRYIMSQIAGTTAPAQMGIYGIFDIAVSAYDALTKAPEPDLAFFDYYIFDDPSLSEKNNGDGIADAGETIGLGVYVRNHWGQAREVSITLDSISAGGVANPYIEWITDTVVYGDIGTFVTANNGILYDEEGIACGISDPFVFKLADNTPNSSALNFNVNMLCCTYDEQENRKDFFFDETSQSGAGYQNSFLLYSRKGTELPRRIDHDMTLTADNYYIISGSTLISSDVTVTIEAGTQLQFWGDYSKELYAGQDVANLHVDGTLIINGTEDNPVEIFPADNLNDLGIFIQPRENGIINISYANIANPCIQATKIDHCYFYQNNFEYMSNLYRDMDGKWYHSMVIPYVNANTITNSKFYELGYRYVNYDYRLSVSGKLVGNLFDSCGLNFETSSWNNTTFTNNVFLKNSRLVESQYGDRSYLTSEFKLYGDSQIDVDIYHPVKNPITGSTYFVINTGSYALAEKVAVSLGGHVVKADNYDEFEFLREYIDRYYGAKSDYYKEHDNNYLISNFGIGFNAISEYNLEHIGEFSETDWLNGEKSRQYPVMSPSNDYISYRAYEARRFSEEGMLTSSDGNYFAIIIELPGEPTLTDIEIDAGEELKLHTNSAQYTLSVTENPSNVKTELTWVSSDPAVATVDATGAVKAIGIGEAVITVTDKLTDISDSITVKVAEYIKPEALTAEKATVIITEHYGIYTLAPTVTPDNATVSPIVWSSSDPTIATVSASGVVTALSSGDAVITGVIADEGLEITYAVQVAIPVEDVVLSFNYTTLYLNIENNKKLEAACYPDYAVAVHPEFISHDTSIVTVDASGVLTPVGTGITVIEVRTETGSSVYCVVNVLSNAAETKIVSTNGDRWGYSAFYTEEGTAWLLRNAWIEDSSDNTLIPQKLPVKVKHIQLLNYVDGWLYIDMENDLVYSDRYFKDPIVLDTEVSAVEKINDCHIEEFFYTKTDGTVWYIENIRDKRTPREVNYLSGIVDMAYNSINSGYHLFIDTTGTLWCAESYAPIEKPASFVKVDSDVKFASFPQDGLSENRVIFTNDGSLYRFSNPDDIHQVDFSYYYNYAEYASHIIKYAPRYEGTGVALLDDGTAVYYGDRDTLRLSGLVDQVDMGSSQNYWFFAPIDGFGKIADIGHDCLILEDGSVVTFHWGGGGKPLGNNTAPEDGYKLDTPVYAWFGVTSVTNETLNITDVKYATDSGEIHGKPDQVIAGVKNDSEIVLTLNRAATEYLLSYISLKDEFGHKVDADIKISYLYITITPKETLESGYEYTIEIPASILSDFFGNENEACRIGFVAAGTATYPNPVTGLTDEVTDIKLGYNESRRLAPAISPADASKKTVLWTVADESVATVNSYGVVTAVNNGTTTVTATTLDGGHTVTYTVTVRIEIESVTLNTSYIILDLINKTTATLIPTITPSNAVIEALEFQSTDEDVATVDQNGVITAKSTGTVQLLVKVNNVVKSCLVNVVADREMLNIVSVYSDGEITVYYAADGTAWLVDDYYDDQKNLTPMKLPFKAKLVSNYYSGSGYLCIDEEDRLCFLSNNMKTFEILDTDVKLVERTFDWRNSFFYVKNDGSVWYKEYQHSAPIAIESLSGIIDIRSYNYNMGYHLFIDTDGALWRISHESDVTEALSYEILNSADIRMVEFANDCVVDDVGNVYGLNDIISGNTSVLYTYTEYHHYEEYKDRIVKITFHSNNDGLALLNDGRVVYFGHPDSLGNYYGLKGYFDAVPEEDRWSRTFIPLRFENVKDIGRDGVVFEDGSVLAFYANSNKILGDGTSYNDVSKLKEPVTPLFGIDISKETLVLNGYEVTVDGTAGKYAPDAWAEKVDTDSVIKLIFNGVITAAKTQYIMMADEFGNKVTVEITVSGKEVLIKPVEPLKEGIQYILTVSNGILTNYFGNSNQKSVISFSIEGTATYDVPVEGLTCGTSSLTMSKDDTISLNVTVTPDNATQKRVVWSTSDATVATVSSNGVVTAHADGGAVITARTVDGGLTAEIRVTVFTTALIDSVNIALGSEQNTQIIYRQGNVAQSITWGSADPSIVTVDENGKLTPVSVGVTAVYVYADGAAVKNFVVSVLPDESYLKVTSAGSNDDNHTYITEQGVWVLNSNYMLPKFIALENVKEAIAYDYTLLVRSTENAVSCISISDGSVYEAMALENVIQVIGVGDTVWALTASGAIYYCRLNDTYTGWKKYEYIENAKQISVGNNHLYILDDSGNVWYTSSNSWDVRVCEFYKTDAEIIDINVCNGKYMKDVDGKLHWIYGSSAEDTENRNNVLTNMGFYELELDIAQYVNYNGDIWSHSFLMRLSDGGLAYFGAQGKEYLEQTFSGLAKVEQSTENDYLYYIKGLPAVQAVGEKYILLENGNLLMCGGYIRLGDGTYHDKDVPKIGTPRLYYAETPTAVEAESLEINGVQTLFGGNASIAVDATASNKITISFSNALALTDYIKLISLKNSAGESVVISVAIDKKSVIITTEEELTSGETYQLVIPPSVIEDIFTNKTARYEALISVVTAGASSVTVYDESIYPTTDYSPDYSKSDLAKDINVIIREIISEYASENSGNTNNAILNTLAFPDTTNWMSFVAESSYQYFIPFANNYWGTTRADLIDKMIYDVNDNFEKAEVIYTPYLTADKTDSMYPFVTGIKVLNAEGEQVSQVGIEKITVIVTFNRDMDTGVAPFVGFGSDYPYGDFQVDGEWTDARTWQGTFDVTAVTGSGVQYFKVRDAVSADDKWLTTGNDYERFTFTISTYGAKSMTLNALGSDGKVDLEWAQDDFDTLMGYNIYRSEDRDAALSNYQKVNSTVISNSKSTYVDRNVSEGKTYYYYFTVVQTDFSESDPSSIVEATVHDTTAPSINHHPVNETAIGGGMAIIAWAYDNIAVRNVTLYYQDASGNYVETEMIETRDEYGTIISYIANIPGTAVGASGVKYYITASDGTNTSSYGSAASPIQVRTYTVYEINVMSSGSGSISVSKSKVGAGETVYVTVTPNEGYVLVPGSLTYTDATGTHQINNNSFTMPASAVSISVSFAQASAYGVGDVNRDGRIDSADAVLILRYDAGLVTLDSEQQILADITADGRLDVADAAQILRIDAGY